MRIIFSYEGSFEGTLKSTLEGTFYISWAKQTKIQISLQLIFSELQKTITNSNVTAATAWKVKIGT